MSKLSEIVFKPVESKEYDVLGKKVVLRTLKTKDAIEMDLNIQEDMKSNELLKIALETLSRAIVSIDGIIPDSPEETKEFLENQESNVVFEILTKYQELNGLGGEELKNSEGTPS